MNPNPRPSETVNNAQAAADKSVRAPVPEWSLRYLIGYAGVAGAQRLDTIRRTGYDALHGMQTYLCATKAEWDLLGKTLVCKANRRLLQVVELFCEATGERRRLSGGEQFTMAEGRGAPLTVVDGGCQTTGTGAGVDTGAPSKELPPHQERVLREFEELGNKLSKLEKFIAESPVFGQLPQNERALLQQQFQLMSAYESVLGQRIYNFTAADKSVRAPVEEVRAGTQEEFQTPKGSQSGGSDELPGEPEGTFLPEEEAGDGDAGGTPAVAEKTLCGARMDATAAADASSAPVPSPETEQKKKGGRPRKNG